MVSREENQHLSASIHHQIPFTKLKYFTLSSGVNRLNAYYCFLLFPFFNFSCSFFFFASAVIHVYSGGTAKGSWIFSILQLELPVDELGRWYGAFIHWNQDVVGCTTVGLSMPGAVGLDGGVWNSSSGCNSSNLVKVTSTLIVGTTGIATWNNAYHQHKNN